MELTLDNIDEVAEQKATTGDAPTEKQVRFAKALLRSSLIASGEYAKRDNPEELLDCFDSPNVTRSMVSKYIDTLLSSNVKPVWDAPVPGQIGCSEKQHSFIKTLAAERGVDVEDAWLLTRSTASEAITRLKALPRVSKTPAQNDDLNRGDVHVVDGEFYRVHVSQSTGGFYACRWDGTSFDYEAGAVSKLTPENKITAEQAAEFGLMYSRCCFCSRDLDTPESTSVGYGPTCANKHGLPWG